MTPNEALLVLDQATAQLSVPRVAHNQILNALNILKEFVEQQKEPRTDG